MSVFSLLSHMWVEIMACYDVWCQPARYPRVHVVTCQHVMGWHELLLAGFVSQLFSPLQCPLILNFFIRKMVNMNKNTFYLDFLRHFSRLHFSLVQVPLVAKWNVRSDWRESGTWRYKQNRDQSIALLVVQSVGEIHLLDWDRGWPRHICCFVRRKNRRN